MPDTSARLSPLSSRPLDSRSAVGLFIIGHNKFDGTNDKTTFKKFSTVFYTIIHKDDIVSDDIFYKVSHLDSDDLVAQIVPHKSTSVLPDPGWIISADQVSFTDLLPEQRYVSVLSLIAQCPKVFSDLLATVSEDLSDPDRIYLRDILARYVS